MQDFLNLDWKNNLALQTLLNTNLSLEVMTIFKCLRWLIPWAFSFAKILKGSDLVLLGQFKSTLGWTPKK